MTESVRSLAAAVALARAPGSLADPAVASLLAALVGGMHGPAVQVSERRSPVPHERCTALQPARLAPLARCAAAASC